MFEINISHGGGLNEHISGCKQRNIKKLEIVVQDLLDIGVNESQMPTIKLEFVVSDIATMTSDGWLKDNMPAIKANLATIPDSRKTGTFKPYICVRVRELCECLVELSVLRMCEDTLESPVA
jgi:hypothetical protein